LLWGHVNHLIKKNQGNNLKHSQIKMIQIMEFIQPISLKNKNIKLKPYRMKKNQKDKKIMLKLVAQMVFPVRKIKKKHMNFKIRTKKKYFKIIQQ